MCEPAPASLPEYFYLSLFFFYKQTLLWKGAGISMNPDGLLLGAIAEEALPRQLIPQGKDHTEMNSKTPVNEQRNSAPLQETDQEGQFDLLW